MCRYLKTCKGSREWRRRRSRELLWHRGIEPRGTSRRENQKLLTAEIGERREGAAESTQAEKFVSLRISGVSLRALRSRRISVPNQAIPAVDLRI